MITMLSIINLITVAFASQGRVIEELECDQRQMLKNLTQNYDKTVVPNGHHGVDVHVELHIQEISTINELESAFVMDVLFSAIWQDDRLRFKERSHCSWGSGNITLDNSMMDKFWNPNVCFINSKSARIHESPTTNLMLILYSNGTIWQNYRMKVTGPCEIDLRRFPFDTQKCRLLIESYSYNVGRVRLQWYPEPVTMMSIPRLPDFIMLGYKTNKSTMEYPNGRWDRLDVIFAFKRQYGFFILQAYIPTVMTMGVAWISMWMDHRQIGARSTLGISAFLAMTLQFGNLIKNQPPVSYIKGLDIWMMGGIFFMFATLAELAIISYNQQRLGTLDVQPFDSVQHSPARKATVDNQLAPATVWYQFDENSVVRRHQSLVPLNSTIYHQNMNPVDSGGANTNNNHVTSNGDYNPGGPPVRSALEMADLEGGSTSKGPQCCTYRKDHGFWHPSHIDSFCRKTFVLVFFIFNLFYWLYYLVISEQGSEGFLSH